MIGAYTSWEWQTLASVGLTVIGHALLLIVPESPRYLVSKGKFEEAKKSLSWLKNTEDSQLVEDEIEEVSRGYLKFRYLQLHLCYAHKAVEPLI